MPTIVTFTPLQPPERTPVKGRGRSMLHVCRDGNGQKHRQRLAIGSVRGIFYLDALCLHCGAHFMWVEDDPKTPDEEEEEQVLRAGS
jgi:hypothetical protein